MDQGLGNPLLRLPRGHDRCGSKPAAAISVKQPSCLREATPERAVCTIYVQEEAMQDVAFAAICVVTLAALAPCGAQPPGPLERWRSELELTEDQITRIDEVQYASRVDEIARRADLERAELELDREMRKPAADESAVLRLFDAVHEARGQLERLHLRTRLKIRGILTPEQHQRLEDLQRREDPPNRFELMKQGEEPFPPRPPEHR